MSKQERARLAVMAGVKRQELTLVQASGLLEVSYRQCKRIWQRYRKEGDAGLVHRLRGQPSHRAKGVAVREQVLALQAQAHYADFGPTLLAEHLERQGLRVNHETVRRWLLAAGRWTIKRRRQRHRQWRERKANFGEMVQLDGSHHDWFEGRGPKCVLMVMVDDATNRVWAQFFEEETTAASYEVFGGWVKRQGLPRSLYVDRDSIYRAEGRASVAEELAGKRPQTQFGRAMEQLGVKLILATSPQAKGRVERINGVLQDRLVKELRLAGIKDLASGNEFLRKYLAGHNRRFERMAASSLDAHQPAPRDLHEILSWEETRVVQGDWTVACGGKWYQLDRQHEGLSLVRRKVIVRRLRDGREQIVYAGQKLKWRVLPTRPARKEPVRLGPVRTIQPPTEAHPWRQFGLGAGKPFWGEVKAAGRLARAAQRLGRRASGRPSLRSGLPTSRRPNRPSKQRTNNTTRGHSLTS